MNTYWFLELESLAVQRASPPNCKLEGHEAGRCPAHKFPPVPRLSGSDHNQLDGTMPPAASQATDQQWCPARPTPSQAAGSPAEWTDTQRTKIINSEPVEGMLPRSGDTTSHFSSLANWPCELGKVRPSTCLDLGPIIYKVRPLN